MAQHYELTGRPASLALLGPRAPRQRRARVQSRLGQAPIHDHVASAQSGDKEF